MRRTRRLLRRRGSRAATCDEASADYVYLERRLPTIFASGADDRRRSRRGLVAATRDSYRLGVEELETVAPPADLDAREITVTLAQSGPRYVSADREFAVWSATVGEALEGEPVTLAGPLGQVNAGERLVCSGVF